MFTLPEHLRSLIFSFDSTYRDIMTRDVLPCILNDGKNRTPRNMHMTLYDEWVCGRRRHQYVMISERLIPIRVPIRAEPSKTHRGSYHTHLHRWHEVSYKYPIRGKAYRRWKKRQQKYKSWSYSRGVWTFHKFNGKWCNA